MADCSGCPYLKQEADHALCTARGDEVIDEASYTKDTCEHYQAHLQAQAEGGEAAAEGQAADGGAEDPGAEGKKAEKKEKEKNRGSTTTGCLISLLVAASLMFLCVLAMIGVSVFFGQGT